MWIKLAELFHSLSTYALATAEVAPGVQVEGEQERWKCCRRILAHRCPQFEWLGVKLVGPFSAFLKVGHDSSEKSLMALKIKHVANLL